jgi:hypothetical protein
MVRPLGEVAGTTEGSSVNVWPGFDGSRSWFLYFDGAKRLNGGILTKEQSSDRQNRNENQFSTQPDKVIIEEPHQSSKANPSASIILSSISNSLPPSHSGLCPSTPSFSHAESAQFPLAATSRSQLRALHSFSFLAQFYACDRRLVPDFQSGQDLESPTAFPQHISPAERAPKGRGHPSI